MEFMLLAKNSWDFYANANANVSINALRCDNSYALSLHRIVHISVRMDDRINLRVVKTCHLPNLTFFPRLNLDSVNK